MWPPYRSITSGYSWSPTPGDSRCERTAPAPHSRFTRALAMAVAAPGFHTSPRRRPAQPYNAAQQPGSTGGRTPSIPIPIPIPGFGHGRLLGTHPRHALENRGTDTHVTHEIQEQRDKGCGHPPQHALHHRRVFKDNCSCLRKGRKGLRNARRRKGTRAGTAVGHMWYALLKTGALT